MKKLIAIRSSLLSLVKPSSLAGLVFVAGIPGVQAELPVPLSNFSWGNNARIAMHTDNYMRITQNEGREGNWYLNWDSFNISPDSEVEFVQPSATHIALNRIYQSNPSHILGAITANGRVYLINQNGFLFGSQSSINVNSLVASSLSINMTQDEFVNGDKNIATLINEGEAAFTASGPLLGITIEEGAQINTQDGGSVMMFAPSIFNAGDINTQSGQTILAATEDKVYLTPSTDPALRGFLVEVGVGGDVTNAGHILSERGNISLAGLSINQNGILEATSSVNENGSIRLLARDSAEMVDRSSQMDTLEGSQLILGANINLVKDADGAFIKNDQYAVARNTGDLTLGENSQIIIKPQEVLDQSTQDITDDILTLTDAQKQIKSRVELSGHTIEMQQGAEIVTPGGEVIVHATSNPLNTAVTDDGVLRARDDSKFVMQSGSRIDVSGTTDARVDMQRNQLEVQLTGNFLRDAPLQRESELRNERVNVDIRQGTPLGNISELVAGSIERNASERFSAGGDINILSQGGVLLAENSEINIHGGKVTYNEGYVTTSRLVASNREIVDITEADPNRVYQGVFGQETIISPRWGENSERSWSLFGGSGITRYYSQYSEGQDGGNFNLQTYAAVLDHTLVAGTDNGAYQRELAQRASGGAVNITLADPTLPIAAADSALAQSIAFVGSNDDQINDNQTDESTLDEFLASTDTAPEWLLQINDEQLNNGLSNFTLATNGDIQLAENAEINLASNGKLALSGRNVQVDSDIKIASGDIDIRAEENLAVSSVLNTSGNWVNDDPFIENRDLLSEINLHGGSIQLSSQNGNVSLQESLLQVNGGAWLDSDGNISVGDAGSIALSVKGVNGARGELQLGEMQAYAAGRGGALNITTNEINIANEFTQDATTGELQFTPAFFQSNGFSDYRLVSNTDNLTLHSDTELHPTTQSYLLNDDIKLQASADNLTTVSEVVNTLPAYLRPHTNLTLGTNRSAVAGVGVARPGLNVQQGSRIELETGASLNLFAERNLFMNGDIRAPGGDVSLVLNVPVGAGSKEYEADQAIWLGGSIDVRGDFIAGEVNDTGLLSGDVYNAGSVSLEARRGYIVTDENSSINVSGEVLQQQIDLPSQVLGNTVLAYDRQSVVTEAGEITLNAAEGMLLHGNLQGQAADLEGAAGGRLRVEVNSSQRGSIQGQGGSTSNGTNQSREIHITQTTSELPAAVAQGDVMDTAKIGQAWLAADTVKQGGFSQLLLSASNTSVNNITSRGVIEFHNDIDLSLSQSLQLIAPIIRAQGNGGDSVNLAAPYVLMGSVTSNQPDSSDAITDGNVALSIHAGNPGEDGLLELMGNIHTQGWQSIDLASEGDLRLRGVKALSNDTSLSGSLQSFNDVHLEADQIYATTLSQFDITVNGAAQGELRIDAASEHAPILSAGSQLNFSAPIIHQAGVVKAPQGQINFSAGQSLTLADGSITSVSGENSIVPFGSTLGQQRWIYTYGFNDTNTNYSDISAPPSKEINLQAPVITMGDTASFDISGGGDLYSWEFVPGLGGSVDTLMPQNANGAFAVMPGMNDYAPFDNQNWLGVEHLSMGDQVYLNGSDLLAEGLYTKLPARYALLPGAILVTPNGDNLLPSQEYARLDGAPIVAGQNRIAGTGFHDALWNGYIIESGENVRDRSEYFESYASQYFRDAALNNDSILPSMPEDAGVLNILAGVDLKLAGQLSGEAGRVQIEQQDELLEVSGRGSLVNIGGDHLRVVHETDNNAGIQLLDVDLNEFAASSLMIGGTRVRSDLGIDVTETASIVSVENGVELNVPDLYLVSQDTIDVSGATIIASGDNAQLDTRINLDGDGALLRVSAAEQIVINRSNESVSPTTGRITIADDALLRAEKSIALDGSADTDLQGDLQFTGDAGSLLLGASQISIGDVTGNPTGLVFSDEDIQQLNASELVLSSRGSIGFYGNLDLAFINVAMQAGSIDGHQSAGENLRITADSVSLLNPANYSAGVAPAGVGNLNITADTIVLDEGESLIRGFNQLSLNAHQGVLVSAEGSLSSDAQQVEIDAAVIAANNSSADYQLNFANAPLTIKSTAENTMLDTEQALGARLNIQAERINQQGEIRLASGYLTLQATGVNADDGVSLADHSLINLSGITRDFAGESTYTPGGELSLIADQGSILMQSQATIDVSGGGGKGNAGLVSASAIHSSVDLGGDLIATHDEAAQGGRVTIDASTLVDFAALNTELNQGSEFNQQRSIRLRNADISLAQNESIIAQQVLLQADNGSVTVAGDIDARGNKGGKVHLAALNDVTVASSASINASALTADGEGGDLRVETRNGFVDLQAGSEINVAGGENYRDGTIYIRTPRNAANDGVNISSVASNMQGFRRLDIEGYETAFINDGTISGDFSTGDLSTSLSSASLFAGNNILGSLDFTVNTDYVHIRPGIELLQDTSTSYQENINLNSAFDFFSQRYGDEAGVLTIRSAGNLSISKNMDDGFLSETNAFGNTYDSLQAGESWSYNLVAGADFTSANLNTVNSEGTGNLTLVNNKRIRTGTGSITLAASGDIALGTDAAVYTAGQSNGRGSLGEYVPEIGGNALDLLILPEIEYPVDGGDINLIAGGSISANATSRLVTDWLHRSGETNEYDAIVSTWGINFGEFKHGVAAMGGGDIYVQAESDINDLAIAIPQTGKQLGEFAVEFNGIINFVFDDIDSQIETLGRGDLQVNSAGNIANAQYYVGDGQVNVSAARNIGSDNVEDGLFLISANTHNTIYAGGNIYFQGANNQTLLPLSTKQEENMKAIGLDLFGLLVPTQSFYSTLTAESEINLASLNGDIIIRNAENTQASYYKDGIKTTSQTVLAENRIASIMPSRFSAVSFDGDIVLQNDLTLWPAEKSHFSLLANQSFVVNNSETTRIDMLDIAVDDIPNAYNPVSDFTLTDFPETTGQRSARLTHIANEEVSRIVTNQGDIKTLEPLSALDVNTTQQTEIISGRDMIGVSLDVQHSNATDISVLQAARDFEHINGAELGTTSKFNSVRVTGPGELHLLAGRNIDLGDQKGVVSAGNNDNPALPDNAADILIMAGLGEQGADYQAFIDQYFTEGSEYAEQLTQFMQDRNNTVTSFADALTAFNALQEKQQRQFVLNAFANEYHESAIHAANEQAGNLVEGGIQGYSRGLNAIATLFPDTIESVREASADEITGGNLLVTGGSSYVIAEDSAYQGNLSMVASTIQVQDNGGDISILTPGGFINVGLSVASDDEKVEKGIITKGDGAINVYAFDDVAVNQSRIQALNTGDINIWSTQGDIDAGRGAKSALSFPPPRNVVDPESGAIIQVLDAAVQGSGIRTACFDTNCVAGDVVLAAPKGVIDAGDAGINSGSGIILATETVLNANQIEAGGETTGVPTDVGSLGADLGGMDVNSAGEEAGTELVATDASDQFGAGSVAILQVEVMGLSDDLQKADGLE